MKLITEANRRTSNQLTIAAVTSPECYMVYAALQHEKKGVKVILVKQVPNGKAIYEYRIEKPITAANHGYRLTKRIVRRFRKIQRESLYEVWI